MRPLPSIPVFGPRDAATLGWSNSALERAARAGRLVRVSRGQYARPGDDADRVLAVAAARTVQGSAISHRSALLVQGLPLVGARPRRPEITVAPRGTGDARCALLHRAGLPECDLTGIDGVLVTAAGRTLVDVARSRPLTTSVPAIDAALHRRLVTRADLDTVVVRCWNWPGIARAQRALRLADGRAESPLESVSRLVIGWLGLPRPELQAKVLDRFGHAIARLDFYWDEFGAAGEADGRSKYTDREVLNDEKERQESSEDLGLTFARWQWKHVVRERRLLRLKIDSAFARGQARDGSGLPRQWSIQKADPIG